MPIVDVTCDRCGEASSQRSNELLRFEAACPLCGATFESAPRSMHAGLDAWGSYTTWCDLLIEIEDRLGVASPPGIPDHPLIHEKQGLDLTLHDLARTIQDYRHPGTSPDSTTIGLVLDAAAKRAGAVVSAGALDRPLFEALGIPYGVERFGRKRIPIR